MINSLDTDRIFNFRSNLNKAKNIKFNPKFNIVWSKNHINRLEKTAEGKEGVRSSVDIELSKALLLCSEGNFDLAKTIIIDLLLRNIEEPEFYANSEFSISFLNALFTSQQFEVLSIVLQHLYDFPYTIILDATNDIGKRGCIRWNISENQTHRFTFDALAYRNDSTRDAILAFQWSLPLYVKYASYENRVLGSIIINQQDIGLVPGLCWSENRPNYFLVPDCIFIPTRGYKHARDTFESSQINWVSRKPIAFWRGATTGIPISANNWESLERIRLCRISHNDMIKNHCDIGISSIIQMNDTKAIQAIKDSGLVKGHVPWETWNRYKYLVDIDGNSSPWSNLFQKLLTGSPVLKVDSSRGLRQWYYHKLVPWKNYVPISSDMSDFCEKLIWLIRNDNYAKRIGENGRELALSMTLDNELDESLSTIAAAFRYFASDEAQEAPFGIK